MIKKHSKFVFLFLTIFLVSCVETEEIESSGIINAQGMDITSSDKIKSTLVVFQFTAQSDAITKIIKGEGYTVEGAIEDAEHSSLYRLVPGKLKLTLFGEELAKQGVFSLMDTQARDTRVPDLMYLAVGKPNAEEILSIDEKELSLDPGQYLYDIIYNHSRDHNIPRKSLQDFLRIYYDVGQDNILPTFKMVDDMPKNDGGAIFSGDKMVGEISNKEIIYVNLIQRTVENQVLELKLPIEPFEPFIEPRQKGKSEVLNVAVVIENGKSNVKLIDIDALKYETNTTIKLSLLEQSGGVVLQDPKAIETLEDEIKKKLVQNMDKTLEKVKDYKSDPFGFGLIYKKTQQGKNMSENEWREKFPAIDVSFNIDVKLIRHGVTD